MKQKHTQAKKANRSSAYSKSHNSAVSKERALKRKNLQPKQSRCYGQQVHHIQTIKKEIYKGVRLTISINIEHAR